jgi:hypothetical protein
LRQQTLHALPHMAALRAQHLNFRLHLLHHRRMFADLGFRRVGALLCRHASLPLMLHQVHGALNSLFQRGKLVHAQRHSACFHARLRRRFSNIFRVPLRGLLFWHRFLLRFFLNLRLPHRLRHRKPPREYSLPERV